MELALPSGTRSRSVPPTIESWLVPGVGYAAVLRVALPAGTRSPSVPPTIESWLVPGVGNAAVLRVTRE